MSTPQPPTSRDDLVRFLGTFNEALRAAEPAANALVGPQFKQRFFADPDVIERIAELSARGALLDYCIQQLNDVVRLANENDQGDTQRASEAWEAGWARVMTAECCCPTCAAARDVVNATLERVREQVRAEGKKG